MHVKLLSSRAFFSAKCIKYRSAAGLRSHPLGELTDLPRPIAGLRGPTFKGKVEKGKREGEGKEREICLILIFLLATPLIAILDPF